MQSRFRLLAAALLVAVVATGIPGASAEDDPGEVEFHGVVEALPGSGLVGDWVVSGVTVHVTASTRIEEEHGPVAVGAFVEVKGLAGADGSVTATKVEVKETGWHDFGEVEFHGVVEALPGSGLVGDWVVSGVTVHVTASTRIEEEHGPVAVGAFVEVKGLAGADGSVTATKVEVEGAQHPNAGTVNLVGKVERVPRGGSLVGVWRVSHHRVRVGPATKIVRPALARQGSTARVVGRWLHGGSIRAKKVVLAG